MVKLFDFGENWKRFSSTALTADRVGVARRAFVELTEGIPLEGSHFLDVGFGQGLAALCAASAGAKVDCVDIDKSYISKISTIFLNSSNRFFCFF